MLFRSDPSVHRSDLVSVYYVVGVGADRHDGRDCGYFADDPRHVSNRFSSLVAE